MNRAERRKAEADERRKPAVLTCTDCGSSDFVYHSQPLTNDTSINCGGCGKVFGTYATILGSLRYSRKPGATLEGRKRAVFEPVYRPEAI